MMPLVGICQCHILIHLYQTAYTQLVTVKDPVLIQAMLYQIIYGVALSEVLIR